MNRLLAAFTLLAASSAHAQPAPRVQLNRYRAAETAEDAFALSRPSVLGHLRFSAQLQLDYAHDPLVYEARLGDGSTRLGAIVAHQLTATATFALGLANRMMIYGGLPVVLAMEGDGEPFGRTPEADGPGVGDASMGARFRVLGDDGDRFRFGAQVTGTFPTGRGNYRGDASLSINPELLFELTLSPLVIDLDLGARIREDAEFQGGVTVGDELTWAVGVGVPVWTAGRSHLDLHAQAFGAFGFADFFGRNSSSAEALGGIRLMHGTGMIVGAAAGGGLVAGFGTPEARAVVQVGYASPVRRRREAAASRDADGDGVLDGDDRCPNEPEDADGFHDADGCPDRDDDGDGILDDADRCPNEAEDADGSADDDGCPDPDNDGDGIADAEDSCPDQAEDFDQVRDDDGCPEDDVDGDGVTDGADACPTVAGEVANGGCPDADRDADGVVDRLDNCPDEAGTEANHGCRERQRVVIHEDRLEILDKVYFTSGRARIRGRSFPLLRNVAAVLQSHPEITRMRIEGHTDSAGDDAANLALSENRAQAVRAFLIGEGVAETRLRAYGFGETRPLEDNASSEGRAANRRVEFNLGDAATAGGRAREPGPPPADGPTRP